MPSLKKYLVISGATATGKTSCSINLAKGLKENIEIVNFDSLLFYKDLNIGTAKPTLEEQGSIPHHLIDISDISAPLNASKYNEKCLNCLEEIWSRGAVPLLVGGSGFYLKALEEGMFPGGSPSPEAKTKVSEIFMTKGIEEVIRLLGQYDPKSAEKLHPNDEYRLTRALEFYFHTGESISDASERFEKDKKENGLGLKSRAIGLHFNLDVPKPEHFPIICQRTKTMLENGLLEETKEILSKEHITGEEKPLLSIGYKQAQMYLKGEFSSHEEMEERINIATRQLAKAQRTWFNSNPGDYRFDSRTDSQSILELARKFLIS